MFKFLKFLVGIGVDKKKLIATTMVWQVFWSEGIYHLSHPVISSSIRPKIS